MPDTGGTPEVTIGEFARLTHLSVKTLHHYHAEGVLEPSSVDPATGYRRYALDQLERAQLVRRLRAVRMPVPQLRAVVTAPDRDTRQALIAAHLADLRRELTETAAAVAGLQSLLAGEDAVLPPGVRALPDLPAVTCTAEVTRAGIAAWCAQTYPRLYAAAGRLGGAGGPGGALYDDAWFEQDAGQVTAFVPLAAPSPHADVVPGGRHAVVLHAGAYEDLDRTYAALGRRVVELGGDLTGPIRETYLVSPGDTADPRGLRTEVCWPLPHPADTSTQEDR
jgi:DNA-binding transcriptional MerR regulator